MHHNFPTNYIIYKLGVTVHRCLHDKAPEYLVDCCTPVSDIASRRHLRSVSRHHLTVPRHRLSTLGRRAFSVGGSTVWNSLPALSSDRFISDKLLKTNLFRCYHSAHTQRSRDASWLFVIYIDDWHWRWHWHIVVTAYLLNVIRYSRFQHVRTFRLQRVRSRSWRNSQLRGLPLRIQEQFTKTTYNSTD